MSSNRKPYGWPRNFRGSLPASKKSAICCVQPTTLNGLTDCESIDAVHSVCFNVKQYAWKQQMLLLTGSKTVPMGDAPRQHSPLTLRVLLQVQTTNLCEGWHNKLKLSKGQAAGHGIAGMVINVIQVARDVDNKALTAAREFRAMMHSIIRSFHSLCKSSCRKN
jgi:hypothetical protein